MKKFHIFTYLIIFFHITSCTTLTTTDNSSVIQTKSSEVDHTKAYFLVSTEGQIGVLTNAIILKNQNKKSITIRFQKENTWFLIKVEPGTYVNDFNYYLWDLFYWSKAGSYNVDPSFKKNFSVEANKIYYLGNYTSKGFYLIKNYKEIIIKQFSNFVDLEIVSPYI